MKVADSFSVRLSYQPFHFLFLSFGAETQERVLSRGEGVGVGEHWMGHTLLGLL
jgi:hypothetical protein